MSYTTVYSGATVNPANQNQNQIYITNNANIQFNWPSNSGNSVNPLVSQMIISVEDLIIPGYLILPDATLGSVGFESVIFNISDDTLRLRYFDGSAFISIAAGSTYYIALTDSSTQNGSWLSSVWAGGASITSITQTQPASGFTITPSTTVTGGDASFTYALNHTLASLETIGSTASFGIPCLTSLYTLAVRTIVPGSANITVTNGGGIAGNISLDINLNPTFTTAVIGNLTLNGSQIISDITSGNITTFVDSANTNSGACAFQDESGYKLTLYGSGSLAANITYSLPSKLPARDNSVLATSAAGQINPQNYLTSGIAGAWVNINGSTPTGSGLNIATFNRNGTGSFTVTFSTPFTSSSYIGIGTAQSADGSTGGYVTCQIVNASTANIFTKNISNGASANFSNTSVAFFGQLT